MPSIADILGMTGDVANIANQTIMPQLLAQRRQQEEDYSANARAMVAAGAGILAGNKGNYGAAMPAIGAGLGAGTETYDRIRALQYTNALKQAQLQMNALKAREMADYRKQQTELKQQSLDQLAAIREEREADKRTADQQRHEDKLLQLQNQKDAADERAATAKDALEERYYRDQSTAAQQEMNRENQRAIAEMRVDATAAGRRTQTVVNRDNQIFEYNAQGQPVPVIDPTTGKQMLAQPKGSGASQDPYSQYLKIWRQRKAETARGGKIVPAEMQDPDAWLSTPEGKRTWDSVAGTTATFNPKLKEGYSVVIQNTPPTVGPVAAARPYPREELPQDLPPE